MANSEWTRREVESIVDDYLSMLALELAGAPYSKAAHRRALMGRLDRRSEQAIEYKHGNISAILLEAGMQSIPGYKARSNYQGLLAEVVAERLARPSPLHELAAADADRPMVVPEVNDILSILTVPPRLERAARAADDQPPVRLTTNYLEREARNGALGQAGEIFVIQYERARLVHVGQERLAARIEHTARVRGDHEGYDVLSFDADGRERLIEVKTTKYGADTPFFVTRNELATSERRAALYHVYRLFAFRAAPRLYTLPGAIGQSCTLAAATYTALPRSD